MKTAKNIFIVASILTISIAASAQSVTIGDSGELIVGSGGSSSGVTSVTGDGTLITNSLSTGAVTLTLGYTPTNAAVVPSTLPTAGQLLVGNSGGTAYAAKSLSGDCTLSGAGAITCTESNGVAFGTGAFATIANYLTTAAAASTYATLGANSDITSLTGLTTPLSVAQGGSGSTSPSLVAGTNITITGSWPNQTITASSTASTAFSALTSGTNTQAAMIVGAGASLTYTNTGTINASTLEGEAIGTSGATVPLLSTANTWTQAQTMSAAPILSTLTGYLYCNGASACTASTTIPLATAATNLAGTGVDSAPYQSASATTGYIAAPTVNGVYAYGWNVTASVAVAPTAIDLTTAFSPLAGSSSLVTVGTITTGIWNGTALTASYLPATIVYTGQANTFGAYAQNFASSTLTLPTTYTESSYTITQPAATGTLALTSQLPTAATTSVLGLVSTDGSTISNSSGAISCTTATTSQIGCVEPDGTTITISAGVISSTGSGGISGLTALYIPLAGSATTLTANSPLDYGATTSDILTNTAKSIFSATPAASISTLEFTGTPYSSGTATTDTPLLYINSGATAPTTWSTSGTYIGINLAAASGNILDVHVNGGSSRFSIDYTGNIIAGALTASGRIATTSTSQGTMLTADTTGIGTSFTSTGLTINPTASGSGEAFIHCAISYQQVTAISTVQFGVGMPTPAHFATIINKDDPGSYVAPQTTVITSATVTAVSAADTPANYGTYYTDTMDISVYGPEGTITIYALSGSATDTITIREGSYCRMLP